MFKKLVEYSKTLKRIDPIKKHGDFQLLLDATTFLPENSMLRRRIWHVEHGVYKIPMCQHCGDIEVNWRKTEYVRFCSMKCLANDKTTIDKRTNTLIDRFGVDNPMKSPELKERSKQTNLAKYSCEYAVQSREVIEQRAATNLKKYGNICSLHGSDVQELVKTNNLKKYGYEYPSQSPDFKERVRATNEKNCGRDYNMQVHITDDNFALLNNKKYLKEQHIKNQKCASYIASQLGVTPRTVIMKLASFGIKLRYYFNSMIEDEIADFIKDNSDYKIQRHNRDLIGKELDIYLPELKLAIEVNGNFYHSELNGKDRSYHNYKFNACAKKDITLLHVLESEWKSSKDILKSLILVKLNKTPKKLNARECTVCEVDRKPTRQFFAEHHLHGYAYSSIRIGLYYKTELVSMMTFSLNRFGKKEQYEMTRFVTKKNTNVRGAAGKLFKYFVREYEPTSVVTYAQRGLFTGTVYEKIGFSFSHKSEPNYKYFNISKPLVLFSRIKFQKHKLDAELDHFEPKLSAWENMKNNGYDRIWDCGNNVYVWDAINIE